MGAATGMQAQGAATQEVGYQPPPTLSPLSCLSSASLEQQGLVTLHPTQGPVLDWPSTLGSMLSSTPHLTRRLSPTHQSRHWLQLPGPQALLCKGLWGTWHPNQTPEITAPAWMIHHLRGALGYNVQRSSLSLTDSLDMSVSKLRKTVKDREAWCAARHGLKKS